MLYLQSICYISMHIFNPRGIRNLLTKGLYSQVNFEDKISCISTILMLIQILAAQFLVFSQQGLVFSSGVNFRNFSLHLVKQISYFQPIRSNVRELWTYGFLLQQMEYVGLASLHAGSILDKGNFCSINFQRLVTIYNPKQQVRSAYKSKLH